MSDRYTVAVEGPDGWAVYEASDQQIGLLRAGVPASVALASNQPLKRLAARPSTATDLVVDATGRVAPGGREAHTG